MEYLRVVLLGMVAVVLGLWPIRDLPDDHASALTGSCSAAFLDQLRQNPALSELKINLCDGREVTYLGTGSFDPQDFSWLWEGVPKDGRGGALILLQDDKAGGLVFVEDELYRLGKAGMMTRTMARQRRSEWERLLPQQPWRPATGLTLERVDPTSFYPDHPPGSNETSGFPTSSLEPDEATLSWEAKAQGLANSGGIIDPSPIRVLVAYTTQATEEIGLEGLDPAFHARLMQEITNWSFRMSDVQVAVIVVADPLPLSRPGSHTPIADVGVLSQRLGQFADLHRRREAGSFDLIALVSSYSGYPESKWAEPGSRPSCGHSKPCAAYCQGKDAFFAVDWRCATAKLSFAHELGHILGATHNPEDSWKCNHGGLSGAGGRGYCSKESNWRTVMAERPYDYSKNRPGCKAAGVRLPFWSNPDKDYLDECTGTKSQNNARLLEAAARLVAGFRVAETRRLARESASPSFTELADLCRGSDSVAATVSHSWPSAGSTEDRAGGCSTGEEVSSVK